jgi:hypothetical protein
MRLDEYRDVMGPKYHGTWNLHRHLPADLDFFLMWLPGSAPVLEARNKTDPEAFVELQSRRICHKLVWLSGLMGPKYHGTWNLHRHLPADLDFFLMLSSISGVIGLEDPDFSDKLRMRP